MYPINVVEKETNISKYLLRMWERRYSYPRPERDQKGERVYTDEDLKKLKLIKSLMEEGYRPSKIVHQTLSELDALSRSFSHKGNEGSPVVVLLTSEGLQGQVKEALKNHKVSKVVSVFTQDDIKNLSL